ncbi:PREDICTED: sulfotransferase family cytosolic 1B member 1-like [Gekko japonicus]|uniref:Sulfotransferase n=1 Tax=Gekko japonicus TaxID=146911 RepID=A0ABM1LFS0_GEKJA|nr:PREDICTED: sulfotransferase family cytosolic 1B member 1-like [Gekko japonicus]XP_015284808.1 PREDICTED: sulfotransferase family cytosolic 1B member 1-like [Gekko japonicus]
MANHKDNGETLHEHQEVYQRYPLVPVHGIPLMEPIVRSWACVENFEARPDDLLIATYPKAGTTWTQEIVDLILARGDVEKACRAPVYIRIPFLEMCSFPDFRSGVDLLMSAPSPRVIKTHLPFQLLPKSFLEKDCKIIYVARNAKDNLVSYYFFDRMNLVQPDPGPWDGYIKKFMEGTVAWGSWYDHVRRYWDERANHRILYLFYEDMKEDLSREIQRVKNFLEVDLSESVVQKIAQHTTFQAMKANPMTNCEDVPSTVFDRTISSFMRKGEVGDWKNYFTVAQREMFDADYQSKMEGTALHFRDVL